MKDPYYRYYEALSIVVFLVFIIFLYIAGVREDKVLFIMDYIFLIIFGENETLLKSNII